MAKSFSLEIVTPVREVFAGEIESAVLPGEEGYFGVLPGHTAMLASLGIGYVKIEQSGETQHFSISGGYVEILGGNVKVLAETAEPSSEIDLDRASAARDRAEKRLEEGRQHWDLDRARVALTRSLNRIKVAELSPRR